MCLSVGEREKSTVIISAQILIRKQSYGDQALMHTRPPPTCVWNESLEVVSGALVLQQLLRRQVCEEHLEDGLGVLAVSGVGVPHHTVAQDRL